MKPIVEDIYYIFVKLPIEFFKIIFFGFFAIFRRPFQLSLLMGLSLFLIILSNTIFKNINKWFLLIYAFATLLTMFWAFKTTGILNDIRKREAHEEIKKEQEKNLEITNPK